MRPRLGEKILLVYRECLCGEWCATGEGAVAPLCPQCGRRMVPPGGPPGDDRGEYRREHGLGFAGTLEREREAIKGIPMRGSWESGNPSPHYDPEALKRRLEGWSPTEPVWEPYDFDNTTGGPPWETPAEV
jgi:hypothetical protein